MDSDQFIANKITVSDDLLDFNIYSHDGGYWGEFAIFSVDESVLYANNSFQKFRVNTSDLEFIKYKAKSLNEGTLTIKWKNKADEIYITAISYDYWIQIISFVEAWSERQKFIEK